MLCSHSKSFLQATLGFAGEWLFTEKSLYYYKRLPVMSLAWGKLTNTYTVVHTAKRTESGSQSRQRSVLFAQTAVVLALLTPPDSFLSVYETEVVDSSEPRQTHIRKVVQGVLEVKKRRKQMKIANYSRQSNTENFTFAFSKTFQIIICSICSASTISVLVKTRAWPPQTA